MVVTVVAEGGGEKGGSRQVRSTRANRGKARQREEIEGK